MPCVCVVRVSCVVCCACVVCVVRVIVVCVCVCVSCVSEKSESYPEEDGLEFVDQT